MIELRNSIKRQIGPNKWAIDASIMPLQMREPGKAWEVINPRLVASGGKYVSVGAPYLIEVGSDGARRIYPDRTDLTKYLSFPAIGLFSGLSKTADASGFTMRSDKLDIKFNLRNSRPGLLAIFKSPPAFNRIRLDIDSVGYDVPTLLKAKTGIGMVMPRLTDAKGEQRQLTWTFQNGQLEAGFDLTGLTFPVEFKNAVDVSVAASADDCNIYWNGSAWIGFSTSFTGIPVGYNSAVDSRYGGGMRFLNLAVDPNPTITVAYLTLVPVTTLSNNIVNAVLIGEKSYSPATFSTAANYQARRGTVVGGADDTQITTASVAWNGIPAVVAGTPVNTPSIVTVVQEWANLAGRAGDGTDDFAGYLDDHAGTSTASSATYRNFASWDHATYAPPAIHIEFTTAGGAARPIPRIMAHMRQQWN